MAKSRSWRYEEEIDGYEEPPMQRVQQHHRDLIPPVNHEWQQIYEANQPRWEAGFRIEIPEFKGGTNLDQYVDWTIQVDDVFRLKEVSLDKQVPLIMIRFKDRAIAWWYSQQYKWFMDGRPPIDSWAA